MAQLFVDTYSDTLAAGKAIYVELQTSRGILRQFLLAAAKRKHKDLISKKTAGEKGQRPGYVVALFPRRNDNGGAHFRPGLPVSVPLMSHL